MKNLSKKVKNIFIVLFILSFILDFIIAFIALNTFDIININNTILKIFLILVGSLIYNLGRYLLVIGIYVSIKFGKRRVYHEKLSKEDFRNDNSYFRDIIKNYNPAELSYIDDFNLDNKKDIVAILLMLNKKGIIKFNEYSKMIEGTNSSSSVSQIENYILDNIKFGKIRFNDEKYLKLKELVIDEALKNNLLQKDTKSLNISKIFISIFVAIFLFSFFTTFTSDIYMNIVFETILGIISIIFVNTLPYILFFAIAYIISYNRHKRENPYIRTTKGEEVNRKLEGLKNYLKDFSYIDERFAEEIIIWEDYLIYSVLFNQNKKVIDEIYNTYFEYEK